MQEFNSKIILSHHLKAIFLYRNKHLGRSFRSMGEEIGVAKGTVFNITKDRPENVSEALMIKMISRMGSYKQILIDTDNFTTVQSLCAHAQFDGRMVGLAAPTGRGKTSALEHYQKKGKNVFYSLMTATMNPLVMVNQIATDMGLPESTLVHVSVRRISRLMIERGDSLLILDDVGKLKTKYFNTIQQIYDMLNRQGGIVLAGTMELRNKISNGVARGWSGFDELADRISPWYELGQPSIGDVKTLASMHGIFSEECHEYLHKACKNYRKLVQGYLECALKAAGNGHDINQLEIIRNLPV